VESAGEVVGEAFGLTVDRFVSRVGAKRPPASTGVDAGAARPPRPKIQRSAGQSTARRGLGTCGGARRGLRRACLVVDASGGGLGVLLHWRV
jgi:hypothetical protein